jgi:hypothetical protein
MQIGEYEIPEDWESMTCIYNCGFILVWKRGLSNDSGNQMDRHILLSHTGPLPSFMDWFRFRRRGNNESR